jgi:hypothetical protein
MFARWMGEICGVYRNITAASIAPLGVYYHMLWLGKQTGWYQMQAQAGYGFDIKSKMPKPAN